MNRFLNAMKAQAGALDQSRAQPRFATVTSVDPSTATVRVAIQPEGVLSGWLPVLSAWTGAGWGLVCLPSPGDHVLLLAQEGDAQHGLVLAAGYGADRAPPQTAVGEFWLVHKSGSSLRLLNDGTVRIQGDLHVSGDVYDAQGALSRLRRHYDAHTHPGGGAPSPQD